jgi:hypothetical protein
MAAIWAGIDPGKTHHHCVAIDESGRRLLSRRVANDEPELLQLLADVLALGDEVTWGIDQADGGAALARVRRDLPWAPAGKVVWAEIALPCPVPPVFQV